MFEIFKLNKTRRKLQEEIAALTADKERVLSEIGDYDRRRQKRTETIYGSDKRNQRLTHWKMYSMLPYILQTKIGRIV